MLIVPGAAGEIGILARHAPLVATLKAGGTRVYIRREEEEIRVRDWARVLQGGAGPRWRSWTTRSTHGTSTPSALGSELEEAAGGARADRARRVGAPTAGRSSGSPAPNQLDNRGRRHRDPARGGLTARHADRLPHSGNRRGNNTLSCAGKL